MVAGRNFKLEPIFREGVAEGLLTEEDLRYYQCFSLPNKPGCMAFNCPHLPSLKQNTDALTRSVAIAEGHEKIDRLVRFLQAKMPGFAHSYLLQTADMLGVRELAAQGQLPADRGGLHPAGALPGWSGQG